MGSHIQYLCGPLCISCNTAATPGLIHSLCNQPVSSLTNIPESSKPKTASNRKWLRYEQFQTCPDRRARSCDSRPSQPPGLRLYFSSSKRRAAATPSVSGGG